MKALRAVAAAMLIVSAGCGDAVTLQLRYAPAAGSMFNYEMEQNVSFKLEGDASAQSAEQTMSIIIVFTQSVTGPVEGGTEVRVRVDSVGLSSPQIPPDALRSAGTLLQGLETASVFDNRMQIVRSSVVQAGNAPPQLAAQLGASLRGATFALPEGPIRVGGTWTAETPAPTGQIPGLSKPLMLTSTMRLKSLRVEGADTIVTIAVETSFPKDPIQLDFEATATVLVKGSLRGEQEYSLERHALTKAAMGGTVRVEAKGGAAGNTVSAIDQRFSMRLVGDGATP